MLHHCITATASLCNVIIIFDTTDFMQKQINKHEKIMIVSPLAVANVPGIGGKRENSNFRITALLLHSHADVPFSLVVT